MNVHLGEQDLIKALKKQGLKVQKTSDGYRVRNPSGTNSVTFHPSSLDAAPGIYQQVITKLEGVGFIDPELFKLRQIEQRRLARREAARIEIEAGPYVCEDCGHESPRKMNLGRHQQAARHGEFKAKPLIIEPKKVTVKREVDELKAKRLVRKLKEQIAALNHTTDELISLVEPLEQANHTMREKLKRLEGVVGKLVEEI